MRQHARRANVDTVARVLVQAVSVLNGIGNLQRNRDSLVRLRLEEMVAVRESQPLPLFLTPGQLEGDTTASSLQSLEKQRKYTVDNSNKKRNQAVLSKAWLADETIIAYRDVKCRIFGTHPSVRRSGDSSSTPTPTSSSRHHRRRCW
jgi:hypothetical protein